MIDSCTVDIEYCDRRTNRVLSRKKREQASVRVRKISGGTEIKITARNILDLFITENPVLFDRRKSEGILQIKMLEQFCIVHISDATEDQIVSCLRVLSILSPVAPTRKSFLVSNVCDENDNKENDAVEPKISNGTSIWKGLSGATMNVDKGPPVRSTPEKSVVVLSCDQRKLHQPVKRHMTFGTGTPSKSTDVMRSLMSPQNLRSVVHYCRILFLNCLLQDLTNRYTSDF